MHGMITLSRKVCRNRDDEPYVMRSNLSPHVLEGLRCCNSIREPMRRMGRPQGTSFELWFTGAPLNVKDRKGLRCEPRTAEGSNVASDLSRASYNHRKDPQAGLRHYKTRPPGPLTDAMNRGRGDLDNTPHQQRWPAVYGVGSAKPIPDATTRGVDRVRQSSRDT